MFVKFQIKKEFLDLILSGEKKTEFRSYTDKILKVVQGVDSAIQEDQAVYLTLQNGMETAYPWAIVKIGGVSLYHGYEVNKKLEELHSINDRAMQQNLKAAIEACKLAKYAPAKIERLEKALEKSEALYSEYAELVQKEKIARETGSGLTNGVIMGIRRAATASTEHDALIEKEINKLIPLLPAKSQDLIIAALDKSVEIAGEVDDLESILDEAETRGESFERDYNEDPDNFFLGRFKVSHSTPDQEIFYSESDRVHFNANQDLFGFEILEVIAHGIGPESYEALKKNLTEENVSLTKEFFEELIEDECKEIFLETKSFIDAEKAKRKSHKLNPSKFSPIETEEPQLVENSEPTENKSPEPKKERASKSTDRAKKETQDKAKEEEIGEIRIPSKRSKFYSKNLTGNEEEDFGVVEEDDVEPLPRTPYKKRMTLT